MIICHQVGKWRDSAANWQMAARPKSAANQDWSLHLVHRCEVGQLPSTMQNKYNLSTKTTEILLLNKKKKKNNRDTTTEGCVTPSTCNLSIVPLFIKSTYNSKYRFFTLFKTGAAMMMHVQLTEVSQLFKSFLTACGQTVYTFCTHLNLIHSSSLGWTQSFDTDTATEWKQKKTPFYRLLEST